MKVIISTGHGRLHLMETTSALLPYVDVKLVTGWIPSNKTPKFVINFFGRLLGHPTLAQGLEKRKLPNISPKQIVTCSLSEFVNQFLRLCVRLHFVEEERATVWSWKLYGYQSKRAIKDAQVFHVRSGAGQGGAIMKARKRGLKIVVDHSLAHPMEVYQQLQKAGQRDIEISPNNRFWKLVLKDCNEADLLLVNSNYVKDSFIENGFDAAKISVVELGIRSDFDSLKTDWAISSKLKLLFTGSFGQRKGANLIVECMHKLIQNGVDFRLDIVGCVVADINLPEWFKNNPSIHLHGQVPQEQLKDFLKNADIYIFPSYSEGAAQSLKEAMLAGVPVIASKQSGVNIENKINALVFSEHTSAVLFDSIMYLSSDQQLREKIAKQAIREMRKLSWESYAKKLVSNYNTIVDEKE